VRLATEAAFPNALKVSPRPGPVALTSATARGLTQPEQPDNPIGNPLAAKPAKRVRRTGRRTLSGK